MDKNSEIFLQKYRILEGLLERRYEGRKKQCSSVVVSYIREDDSEPVRTDLDLMREIRNILSHNAGSDGSAVVQPSDEMLDRMDNIIEYVRRPHRACDFGTPAERVFSARPDDIVFDVMRVMHRKGYSHVPVQQNGILIGVLSIRSVFEYLAENGIDSLDHTSRIRLLGDRIRLEGGNARRYMFVSEDTSIVTVRNAFQRYSEKNHRLSAVFVTRSGLPNEKLICMLTPWNVLSDCPLMKETYHDQPESKA